MIEKIKTITYEIRSHGHKTVLSKKGIMEDSNFYWVHEPLGNREFNRVMVKRIIWHLEDVLKCMNTIKKEETEKKKKQNKET